MDKELQVRQIMDDLHIFGEVYQLDEKTVCVEIHWGDWKHEHLRLKWAMSEMFAGIRCESEVTEEDGSDCYSAIHRFYFS